jgi:hypothetical protein
VLQCCSWASNKQLRKHAVTRLHARALLSRAIARCAALGLCRQGAPAPLHRRPLPTFVYAITSTSCGATPASSSAFCTSGSTHSWGEAGAQGGGGGGHTGLRPPTRRSVACPPRRCLPTGGGALPCSTVYQPAPAPLASSSHLLLLCPLQCAPPSGPPLLPTWWCSAVSRGRKPVPGGVMYLGGPPGKASEIQATAYLHCIRCDGAGCRAGRAAARHRQQRRRPLAPAARGAAKAAPHVWRGLERIVASSSTTPTPHLLAEPSMPRATTRPFFMPATISSFIFTNFNS